MMWRCGWLAEMGKLFQTTGGSDSDHVNEADKLVKIILSGNTDSLTRWEQDFVESVYDQLERGQPISGKQVFKLRDIRDKSL